MGKYDDLVRRLNNRRICIQKTGNLNDFPLLQEASVAIKLLEQENEWLREELDKRLQIENDDKVKKGDV